MDVADRILRRGGIAVLIALLAGVGLAKSSSYYGTLLRGFDAQFYYAAARSVVVDCDWDTTNDIAVTPSQGAFKTEYGAPLRSDGGVKNVFPLGLSLIEAAFLVPARLLGTENGPPGYSTFEVGFVAFGLLLLTAFAFQVLYGFARKLASPLWAAAAVLAGWAGTSMLYYTAWFPFSVHPTTFALMVLLLAVADRLPKSRRRNLDLALFGLLAALLFLTRPHQCPYLVILVLWRFTDVVRKPWKAWLPGTLVGLVFCLLAMLGQAKVHEFNTGSFGLIAHGTHDHPAITGHFEFANPHFDVVLFSPVRGLFWITPLVPVAFLGYLIRFRAVPWWGWSSLVNAALQTAILACWSDPGQGDSFGIRLWCEHVPVVVCGLAVLCGKPGSLRWFVAGSTTICTLWTTALMAAYIFGKLKWGMAHADVIRSLV